MMSLYSQKGKDYAVNLSDPLSKRRLSSSEVLKLAKSTPTYVTLSIAGSKNS